MVVAKGSCPSSQCCRFDAKLIIYDVNVYVCPPYALVLDDKDVQLQGFHLAKVLLVCVLSL